MKVCYDAAETKVASVEQLSPHGRLGRMIVLRFVEQVEKTRPRLTNQVPEMERDRQTPSSIGQVDAALGSEDVHAVGRQLCGGAHGPTCRRASFDRFGVGSGEQRCQVREHRVLSTTFGNDRRLDVRGVYLSRSRGCEVCQLAGEHFGQTAGQRLMHCHRGRGWYGQTAEGELREGAQQERTDELNLACGHSSPVRGAFAVGDIIDCARTEIDQRGHHREGNRR
jgi:hypothetical protein